MKRIAGIVALAVGIGCSGGGPGITPSGPTKYAVEVVAKGLVVPWSLAFTSSDRLLVTERPGRVRQIIAGVLDPDPLITLAVYASAEAGLMGMVLDPGYATNKFVYLAYSYGSGTVKIERFRDAGDSLVEPATIIDNIPGALFHAGCRIKFGPDGKLYITTGDGTNPSLAQKLDSLAGKTLRLNADGSIPGDNPFIGDAGARPEVWTLGHRNAQGMAWQPGSGLLFQTEHGPSGGDAPPGGDEVNIVEKGKNYGWPVIHHDETAAGMESPLLEYTPAIAPAGAAFYTGARFPGWKNNLFFTCLKGEGLMRVELKGRIVVSQEEILGDHGRLRDVVTGPDGYLYVATSNRDGRGSPNADDDRILRLVPL